MKLRGIPWLVAAVLVLGVCGKKDAAKAPQKPTAVAEKRVEGPRHIEEEMLFSLRLWHERSLGFIHYSADAPERLYYAHNEEAEASGDNGGQRP